MLLRDQLYSELPPSARSSLHLEVGQLLVARDDPRSAMHHLFEGFAGAHERVRGELAAWVAPVAVAAADAALTHWAFEDASQLAQRALAAFAGSGLAERVVCELELVVAEALMRQGELHTGKSMCTRAAERALRVAASDLFARAALIHSTELATGAIDDGMVSRLRQALVGLPPGDAALRARVLARLATALTPVQTEAEAEEAVSLLRSAEQMASGLEDRDTLLYVLQFGTHLGTCLPEAERLGIARKALDLARELQQPLVAVRTLPSYLTILVARGEHERAAAELPLYDELLASFPQPVHRVRRLVSESLMATLQGDFERSRAVNAAARAIAERPGAVGAWQQWQAHQFARAQLLGNLDGLREDGELFLAQWKGRREPGMNAWVLAALGRSQEARQFLSPPAPSQPWSFGQMAAAEACVLLGDASLAPDIYAWLTRSANRMFFAAGAGMLFGPTARTLGDLALLVGRRADALRHYDEALAHAEKLRFPPVVALCRRARKAALAPAPDVESGPG